MIHLPGAAEELEVAPDTSAPKQLRIRETLQTQQKALKSKQGGYRDTLQVRKRESPVEEVAGLGSQWYDEFAIGWNEIFDQEPVQPQSRQREAPEQAAVSSAPPKRVPVPAEEEASGTAFWASEVLTSKKPPAYLRINGGKRSVIDRGMKEQMLICPISQLRKPADVMEGELEQVRAGLVQEHRAKKRDNRANRRLERRCRVKGSEDLEELEAKYPAQECLAAFPDLVEQADSSRHQSARSAKNFFVDLASRRTVKTVPLTVPLGPTATFHWSTAPHTAR